MNQIISFLAARIRQRLVRTATREPLDHPCLRDAPNTFLDDLPMTAFAINGNGSVELVRGV